MWKIIFTFLMASSFPAFGKGATYRCVDDKGIVTEDTWAKSKTGADCVVKHDPKFDSMNLDGWDYIGFTGKGFYTSWVFARKDGSLPSGFKKVWSKYINTSDNSISEQGALELFDCNGGRSKIVQLTTRYLDGKVSTESDEKNWMYSEPGTMGYLVFEYACKSANNPKK